MTSSLDTKEPAVWFQRVTFYSTLASLCPFIPVPWLDDWARGWVDRRAVGAALQPWGLASEPWQVELLAGQGEAAKRPGCLLLGLLGAALRALLRLVLGLARKLLLFLAVKQASDCFSRAFHEGYLLHRALASGVIRAETLRSRPHLLSLRWAIEESCRQIDPRPLQQLISRLLRGSRKLLSAAARSFASLLRRSRKSEAPAGYGDTVEAREEALLGGLTAALARSLWGERSYREELEKVFQENLARAGLLPPQQP